MQIRKNYEQYFQNRYNNVAYPQKKLYLCTVKKIIPYISVVTAMLIWAGAGIAV